MPFPKKMQKKLKTNHEKEKITAKCAGAGGPIV